MRPTIRRICTIDGQDAGRVSPSEPDRFAVALRLFVGPQDGEGEESFDVVVCTPSWLSEECDRDGFVVGRHHLIVRNYQFEFVQQTLVKLVERYSGATWQEVAAKVSRIGYWEFEDYQDAAHD